MSIAPQPTTSARKTLSNAVRMSCADGVHINNDAASKSRSQEGLAPRLLNAVDVTNQEPFVVESHRMTSAISPGPSSRTMSHPSSSAMRSLIMRC